MWRRRAVGQISNRAARHRRKCPHGRAAAGMVESLLAPHDQRRQDRGEVQAVDGAHALAAGCRSPSARCAGAPGASLPFAATRSRASSTARSPLGRDPPEPQRLRDRRGPCPDSARGEHRAAPSRRPGSAAARSSRWTSLAETAAGDEHEPLAALGELVGELHRDAAAERVPDDRDAVVAERGQQVADAAGVRAERVVTARGAPSWPCAEAGRGAIGREAASLERGQPPASRVFVGCRHLRTYAAGGPRPLPGRGGTVTACAVRVRSRRTQLVPSRRPRG